MIGQRFGRLAVVEHYGAQGRGRDVWLTRCDCGREKILTTAVLNKGGELSCGCLSREKNKDAQAVYRADHRERHKELTRAWRKANPETVREYTNRRRILKLKADGHHTLENVRTIRGQQSDKCAFCRIKLCGKGDLDHIIPLSKGGTDWPRNLQLLCSRCNSSKNAKDQIEWARARGLLL